MDNFRRAGLLTMALVLLAGTVVGQMSPGPLSKAHADLDGPLNCAKCHAFGTGKVEMKCLECHQEIGRRIAAKRGYHGLQVKPGTKSNDCARCHSEHNGLDHMIVRWPSTKERFDHAQAGFRLEGRHAALKCDECHNSKYLDPQDRAVLKRKQISASFAGLRSNCAACHADVHRGEFKAECGECHSQSSWKNPPNFSHNRTSFPLTGKHSDTKCGACHKQAENSAKTIQFKVAENVQECTSCHKDPHANAFGQTCGKCHTTFGWKVMASSGQTFDHSRTRFPLLGKHADVECQKCHRPNMLTPNPMFNLCSDCHETPHKGQFSEQQTYADCKDCHTENGWAPSTFSVAAHAKTDYPLLGKHATVECAKCHTKVENHSQFKLTFAACLDCHKTAHGNQFVGEPHLNRCEDCHVTDDWKPATFTLASHSKTKFALTGAHGAVACSGCHTPEGKDAKYHLEGGHCIDCHKSPHGQLTASFTCESCHKTGSWAEVLFFDHSQTKFALTGRHTAVRCLGCHKPEDRAGVRFVPLAGVSRQCETCHEDAHNGQFKANSTEVICAECHTTRDWRPTQFDHNQHSSFKLDGAHADVPCQMCHTDRRQIAGRLVIQYKGTPRACSACHQ